jgi:hypothetical protein
LRGFFMQNCIGGRFSCLLKYLQAKL